MLEQIDKILAEGNEYFGGEDIRRRLAEAGFFVCKMPGGVHSGACPSCGCEVAGADNVFHARPLSGAAA